MDAGDTVARITESPFGLERMTRTTISETNPPVRRNVPADILVAHMGLTTSGSIGAHTALTLEQAAEHVQALADTGKKINPEIVCLCHGGPIAEPEDAQYVLDNPEGVVGFFGASSIETAADGGRNPGADRAIQGDQRRELSSQRTPQKRGSALSTAS